MREYPQRKGMDITIPAHIHNDDTLTASQRYHLALLLKFSNQGTEKVDYLTKRQSSLLGKGTTERMVINNLKKFEKNGWIRIEEDILSKNTKEPKAIYYTYRTTAREILQESSNATVFEF